MCGEHGAVLAQYPTDFAHMLPEGWDGGDLSLMPDMRVCSVLLILPVILGTADRNMK